MPHFSTLPRTRRINTLTESTIDIVKATAPAVAAHAEQITRVFYGRMFAGNPEVRAYINPAHQASGEQPKALAGAAVAYALNIENLAALGPAVELITHKHCSLGVQPEHYPIVGKHLLDAVREVLAAWGEAYGLLAKVYIDREAAIYADQASAPGGWNGYRSFTIDRVVPESAIVSSFYLKPTDGGPLMDYHPGQYLTLKLDGESSDVTPRNYSLSDRPGTQHYRISVKREPAGAPGAPDGVVSSRLHAELGAGDKVLIGPPCGVFTLEPSAPRTRPLVFLAGGIGVTPLLAMVKSLAHHGSAARVTFVQAARNSDVHALGDELRGAIEKLAAGTLHTRYSDPLPNDQSSGRCDSVGVVDETFLDNLLDAADADYFLCGPKPFMATVLAALDKRGVPAERLHYEFFGPLQSLTLAA